MQQMIRVHVYVSCDETKKGADGQSQIDTHLKSEMMVSSVYLHLSDWTVKVSLRFFVVLMAARYS